MNPKISDFETVRFSVQIKFKLILVHSKSLIATKILFVVYNVCKMIDVLTAMCSGYVVPEYAMHGHFSMKSDVYGIRVIILEIVSGKSNSSTHSFEYRRSLVHRVSTQC